MASSHRLTAVTQVHAALRKTGTSTSARLITYIAKARELLEKDCQLSRQEFLAECLQRLRRYEAAAAKRGQMQVAVNSARLQAELIGLT